MIRALFTALLALATPVAANANPHDGWTDGEIRVVLNSDIRSTNIGVNRDGNTDTVMHHIVEGLVAYREDLTVGPDLASRVEVSEDGRIYTFHLRRGVLFQNGEPFTAAEAKWSLERVIAPKTRHRCASLFNGSTPLSASITRIDATDAHTLVVELEKPTPLFLTLLANVQCTIAMLHPDSVGADGEWIRPIGTGPYMLERWRRGSYILLRRFDGYVPHGEKRDGYAGAKIPYAKYIRFLVVADPGVAVEAVRSGEADLLPIMPPALVDWSMAHSPGDAHQGRALLSWNVLLIAPDDPLLSKPEMRQAIAAAIDIDKVAAFASYGRAQGNFSAISPETPGYGAAFKTRPIYDPARARQLLKEVGYRGEKIVIQTNRRFPTMYDNAVVIHAMLREAGVNARIEVLDYATQLSNFFTGNFQLSAFGYSGRVHGALRYANFIGPRDANKRYQWDSPRAYSNVRRALAARTQTDLTSALEGLHQAMLDELPLIGLYDDYGVSMSSRRISGFTAWPLGRPRLWGVRINTSSPQASNGGGAGDH